MFCMQCGTKNGEDAKFCSNCGLQVKQTRMSSKKKKTLLIVAIVMSILALVGIGFGIFSALDEPVKIAQTEEIEQPITSVKTETEETPKEETKTPKEETQPDSKEKEKTQIIKESQSRVFTIFTETGLGSGFLFEEKGTVVTNAHVVAGFTEVVVRNVNGQQTTGRVIGISDEYDVALIQVDDYAGEVPLEMEINETEIGSEVIALGSPQGLENSASIGYLTGLDRSFESDFQYENVYQVDAQISPGSSGGPLLDAKTGKVIGINSALLTADQSIGFSIPLYTMIDLLQSWSKSPMTSNEVASIFSFYDDYEYDPEASAKADSYYEEYVEEEYVEEDSEEITDDDTYYFDEVGLSDFIVHFRDNYEMALYYEEFYYIEDMLLFGSTAYNEMADYISEITGQGMMFEFTSNEVTDIVIEEDYAVVSTFEVFDFMNAAGEWSTYERVKDYSVVIDEYGTYQITDIAIYD
ncbi:MAG TPA: trypsin-like peptidase domain-containing protein [Paenisporosarcina sp.]|nr:trypsin-like peptidase domain-containing protein [Paenisporosarcina sp.]